MGSSSSKQKAPDAPASSSHSSGQDLSVPPDDNSLNMLPPVKEDLEAPPTNAMLPYPDALEGDLPGKKTVELIKRNKPEDYEDNTNQTGQSHYELRIQDSFYSTPNRPRSKAYTEAVEAANAKKVAKAERKAEKEAKKKKKTKDEDNTNPLPNTVEWAVENTKKLGILNLSKMDLESIPDIVFESLPGTARIINMSFNRITDLDKRLCAYVLVQRLIANGNFLSSIPHCISKMTALKKLDLARNQLTSLPDAFDGMLHLEHVDLSDNQLETLPTTFANLNLTALNLSRNKFTHAPIELASMSWLMDLDLSCNQLTSIPNEYMSLRQLIALNLDSNKLCDFPDAILQTCTELVTLRLRDNPITMSHLESKESYCHFSHRRQIKFKRQLDSGAVSASDLFPADH